MSITSKRLLAISNATYPVSVFASSRTKIEMRRGYCRLLVDQRSGQVGSNLSIPAPALPTIVDQSNHAAVSIFRSLPAGVVLAAWAGRQFGDYLSNERRAQHEGPPELRRRRAQRHGHDGDLPNAYNESFILHDYPPLHAAAMALALNKPPA